MMKFVESAVFRNTTLSLQYAFNCDHYISRTCMSRSVRGVLNCMPAL